MGVVFSPGGLLVCFPPDFPLFSYGQPSNILKGFVDIKIAMKLIRELLRDYIRNHQRNLSAVTGILVNHRFVFCFDPLSLSLSEVLFIVLPEKMHGPNSAALRCDES